MSGSVEEQEIIESRFKTQWADATPAEYDNQPFNQPKNTPWVRLSILTNDATFAALGTTFRRYTGRITVQVFVPENSGTRQAKVLAENAINIFNPPPSFRFDGIQCGVGRITRAGNNNGWAQFNVSVPFRRDHNV